MAQATTPAGSGEVSEARVQQQVRQDLGSPMYATPKLTSAAAPSHGGHRIRVEPRRRDGSARGCPRKTAPEDRIEAEDDGRAGMTRRAILVIRRRWANAGQ